MSKMTIDYENREAMKALRGKLSKRATSSEFNEWMAREICEYIDHLTTALVSINRINDHPGRFNSDIQKVLDATIDTSDVVFLGKDHD